MNKIFALFGALIVIVLAAFIFLCNKPKPETGSDPKNNSKGDVISSTKNNPGMNEKTGSSREYSLSGVPEMAAGFRFNDDGTFEFFYVYGASNRKASGKYEENEDRLILNGYKKPGADITMMKQRKDGSGYKLKIKDDNPQFVKGVVCMFIKGPDTVIAETNSEGVAVVDSKKFDKLQMIHSYFPDMPSEIDLSATEFNNFEFFLNKTLEEVVFNNTILQKNKEEGNETLSFENEYLFPSIAKFVRQN